MHIIQHLGQYLQTIPILNEKNILKVTGVFDQLNNKFVQPFPTYRRILSHLQQTTFENIVTKGEMTQNKQNKHLSQLISTFFSNYTYNYRNFPFFLSRHFQSHLLQICCMWERVN